MQEECQAIFLLKWVYKAEVDAMENLVIPSIVVNVRTSMYKSLVLLDLAFHNFNIKIDKMVQEMFIYMFSYCIVSCFMKMRKAFIIHVLFDSCKIWLAKQ